MQISVSLENRVLLGLASAGLGFEEYRYNFCQVFTQTFQALEKLPMTSRGESSIDLEKESITELFGEG